MKYYFLLFFMFLSFCLLGLSPYISPNQTIQRFWSTKDGLPQTSITDLEFDEKGYLWISTFGGVVRFNGREFKYLNMPDPRVTCLFLDNYNNLWIGTENGCIFKKDGENFVKFSIPEKKNIVRDLAVDKNGVIYAASDLGLWILKNGKWEFLNDFEVPRCTSILISDNEIFIGTQKGLYILKDGILKKEGEIFKNLAINKIKKDKKGNLWVATVFGIYYEEGNNWKSFLFQEKDYPINNVYSIYEDKNGFIWYNLAGNLFVRLNPYKNTITYFHPKASAEWLECFSIVEDAEGSMWFGTTAGLFQLSEGIATTFVGEDNSISSPIRNLMDLGDGSFLLSKMDIPGLLLFKENKVKNFEGLNLEHIYSLAKKGKKIWAGSKKGLFLKEDERVPFKKTKFLEDKNIYSILPLEDDLYVGAEDGLYKIYGENVEIFNEITKGKKVILIKEKKGKFFLGTDGGLIILSKNEYQILNEKDGLKNLFVRAIYVDENDFLWIGTYGGGLYRYDGRNLFSFPENLWLPKTIHLILEDKKGRLWLSSNQGVFCVEKEDLNNFIQGKVESFDVLYIDERDGMLDRECNGGSQPAGFLSEDGFLWVPTVKGIVRINTNFSTDYIPPVYIEKVLIDGKEVEFGEGKIIFPYGKHSMEIHSVSLSYIYPEKCKYKSILIGWDENFLDMGTRNIAYFSNLKPGSYKFKVIADNGFGLWNEEGAEIEIIVPTPFTHSAYFYILISFLIISLFILILNIYTYSLRKRKEKLEKIVERETSTIRGLAELSSKTNLFSSLKELMDFFYENFKNIISYNFVSLLILKENSLKILWAKLDEKEEDFLVGVEIEIGGDIFKEEEKIIHSPFLEDNLLFKYLLNKGILSLMVCPLKYLKEPFGYIIFGKKEGFYQEDDLKTFQDISIQLSSSIKKTYLLEELQGITGLSDKFYTMILHDLKHPMSTINLYIDLLKEDMDRFNEEQREYLIAMEKSAKEYGLLLNDLLDLAIFRGKYLQTHMQKLDIFEFLKEISPEMEKRALGRGFKWVLRIPDKDIELNFDPNRIKQVLENFLSNALKYAPQDTTLTLGAELFEKEAKIYLKDEGFISEEKRKIIEEAFSSSHDPKSFISKVGLGLYIAKSIIEAHNGKIGFESTYEGGSIFYFTLPR